MASTPYGERALDRELTALRATGSGGRNDQVNKSAFAAAQLVAGQQLDATSTKAGLMDAAKATGLDAREAASAVESGWTAGLNEPRAPLPGPKIASVRRPQRRVSAFEYHDADGVTVYRNVRIEPGRDGRAKDFIHEHPDGHGGWTKGRGGIAVPYRLTELVAAPADTIVYMVEGEAKADRLASWGLIATSHKGWKADWNQHVAGLRVVILPDNDHAGAQQAHTAAKALTPDCARVVELALPRLIHEGADVLDWDGDAAELAALAQAALDAPDALPGSPETFAIADLTLWATRDPEPRHWALDRLIPQGEVTLFTGAGGAGKSLFAQQLATCHAAGRPMLGVCTAGGATLYVTAEDDERELEWRQAAICRSLGMPMPALAGKLHMASLRGRLANQLATFDADGTLRPAPTLTVLRSTILATAAKLVLLDNVAHLFVGNENDRGQVTSFANLLSGLCRDYGVTVVLIAHPNKAGADYSGSTAWLNAVRSQLTLRKPADSHDPDARELMLGKANYARQGETLTFRWHDHALILDSDLPDDRRAEIAAVVLAGADNDAFLACLDQRTREGRHVSERPGANYAPTVFGTMPEARSVGSDRLKNAMDRLFRLGVIERGVLRRDKDKGRDIEGLRRPPNATPKRFPDDTPDEPQTAPE